MSAQILQIGDWTVSPAQNRLVRETREIKLEPRAMDVLVILARRAGEVVSLDELRASVWKDVVVGEGSIYLAISQLRRALDGPKPTRRHIETIPKRGYRLAVPVRAPEPRGPFAEPAPPRRVVVLPFESLSVDADQAYFADGLTAELLSALSRVRGLEVVGLTSSSRLKGEKPGSQTIASLGVGHVLDGSVRKWGDRIRVAARLRDTRSHVQLWAKTYERSLSDVFALQDELARAVADALQVALGVGELGRRGMTRDLEAYDEYLRAVSLNLEWRADSSRRAIAHLERAVALDPGFSLAWALLRTVCFNGALLAPSQAAEWQRRGALALERAIALTPESPEVLLESAIHEAQCGSLLAAGEAFERLRRVHLERGTVDRASGPRGIFLLSVGRAKEAVEELARARTLDPLAVAFAHFSSCAYAAAGNLPAALAEVDRGLLLMGLEPLLHDTAIATALALGDAAEIERRVIAFPESDPGAPLHRRFLKLLDRPEAARAQLRQRGEAAHPRERSALAPWAALHGEPEFAFEALSPDPALPRRTFRWWHPLMRDVRRLPAFKELAGELGLVDYWRGAGWSDFSRPVGARDFACD